MHRLHLRARYEDVRCSGVAWRAAAIARQAGLVTANDRWCEVDWTTLESIKVKNVHVLGDATLSAPGMPKSGHMANQHGKPAAAAIVDLLHGCAPLPATMTNTCYSFIDDKHAIHVASVHRYARAAHAIEHELDAGRDDEAVIRERRPGGQAHLAAFGIEQRQCKRRRPAHH